MLVCDASTSPVNLMPVLELALQELQLLASWQEPVTKEELLRAKIQVPSLLPPRL